MASPILTQNVQITSAAVQYDANGSVNATTFVFTPMTGGTLTTGSMSMTFPGLVQFAVGSTYQFSVTPS